MRHPHETETAPDRSGPVPAAQRAGRPGGDRRCGPPAPSLTRRACLALGGLGVASLLGGCAVPAQARARWIDLRVIDRHSGAALPQYPHRGELHIPAEAGMRYALQVTNRSAERLLVVLSIDGVNIVTGETASYEQSGYVLAPGQQAELTGWRKSWSEVAAFEFSRLGESYAARTGRPFDVGVIGAAVFRERVVAPVQPPTAPPLGRARPYSPYRGEVPARAPRDSAAAGGPAPGTMGPGAMERGAVGQGAAAAADASAQSGAAPANAATPGRAGAAAEASPGAAYGAAAERAAPPVRERLGTAHGERETAYTGQTTFERASAEPVQVVAIRYDSRENLVAMGVIREPRPRPRPFPQGAGETGFVADPPGALW